MFGFIREFFRTVFFELRRKLVRRRIKRAYRLHKEVQETKAMERDDLKKAVHDEIETRQMEHAIKPHKVPDNPYTDNLITVDDIMRAKPCSSYPRERVEALWAGRDALEPKDILALDISPNDIMWAIIAVVITDARRRRLIACDIAEEIALPLFEARYPNDERPRAAVATSRRYAHEEATNDELNAAESAAETAVLDVGAQGGVAWPAAEAVWATTWSKKDSERILVGFAATATVRAAVRAGAQNADAVGSDIIFAHNITRGVVWGEIFKIVRRHLYNHVQGE